MQDVDQFEARTRHLRVGLIVADQEGEVIQVGRVAADLLGRSAASLMGRRLGELVREWSGRPRGDVERALLGPTWTLTWTQRAEDGIERMLRSVARPTAGGLELVIDDISERMRRAHELNALYVLKDRLEAAILREERVAPLAGDLGALLDVLASRMGVDGAPRGEVQALLDEAIRLVKRLQHLEAAPARSRRGAIVVRDVVEGIVPLLRGLVGEDAALELDLEDDGATVSWSAEHLRSVVSNLVVNAQRANARHVVVRTRTFEGPSEDEEPRISHGRWLRLSIEDDGDVLDPEARALALRLAPNGSDAGIGLPWVRYLVQEAGGSLHLDCRDGVGTTVSIDLPVLTSADPSATPEGAG